MLNVALFGTSAYIEPILKTLIESKVVNLSLFVTKPDLTHFSSTVEEQKIPTYTAAAYTQESTKTLLGLLQKHTIDIGVVADYGLMIPLSILKTPKHGLINIHFSMLPEFRGACPVQYTILHGKENAAFSIIEMLPDDTPHVDSGKILYQKEFPLTGTETTESLYTELFIKASHDLERIISDYAAGNIAPTAQDHAQATYTTPSGKFDRTTLLKKEDAYITSEDPDIYIYRAIRAFTPWPRAYTTLGELVQIAQRFDPKVTKVQDRKDPNIRVQLLGGHLEKGQLVLDCLQADGKKPTLWKEFKNGYFE